MVSELVQRKWSGCIYLLLILYLLIPMFGMSEERSDARFIIMGHLIGAPLYYLLLLRQDGEICAIQVLETKSGNTIEEWEATYNAYRFIVDESHKSGYRIERKTRKLRSVKSFGIGRMRFGIGSHLYAKCGRIRVFWSGDPNGGTFYWEDDGSVIQRTNTLEMAPTAWSNIDEVDLKDPEIKWYKYDLRRDKEQFIIHRAKER